MAPSSECAGGSPDVNISLGSNVITSAVVQWRISVRGNPHLLIAGLPGMGKTTCLLNICRQMVAHNIRPIIFSYHQDIDERLQEVIGRVRFVDFDGLGFNPLHVRDRGSARAYLDVAGAVRDIFAAIFPTLGDLQCDRIRTAIKSSFEESGWTKKSIGSDLVEPKFRRFLEILRDDRNIDQGLRTLLVRLNELDDYGLFDESVNLGSLWDSEYATVVRVHSTQSEVLQRAFSSLIFYGLYKDMFARGVQDHVTHAVLFDEAHKASRLKLIPAMAKECRKYGVSLVLASQEAGDFDRSVFSAVATTA